MMLCHIEVQGETKKEDRPLFAERMFRYHYRIFDRYQKPMTAIAIFTAGDGIKMPDRYEYEFLGTSHIYRYNTYRITDPTDEELIKSDNPFALVVLAARTALLKGKIPELELKEQKLLVAKLLIAKRRYLKKKIDAILTFLNNYVLFEKQETNRIFKEQLDRLTGKKDTMGIIEQLAEIKEKEGREEGLRKGLREGRREAEEKVKIVRTEEQEKSIKILLANTELSVDKIAALVGVPISFVENVKQGVR